MDSYVLCWEHVKASRWFRHVRMFVGVGLRNWTRDHESFRKSVYDLSWNVYSALGVTNSMARDTCLFQV